MTIVDLIPWRRTRGPTTTSDWSPVFSIQRDINRIFDEFWTNGGDRLARVLSTRRPGRFVPDVDISVTDSVVDLSAEVPGLTDKNIRVSLSDDGDKLTIEGDKAAPPETNGDSQPHCAERRYGQFRRVVSLPAPVDAENIDASCAHGVLTVRMHRLPSEAQHATPIPIRPS